MLYNPQNIQLILINIQILKKKKQKKTFRLNFIWYLISLYFFTYIDGRKEIGKFKYNFLKIIELKKRIQ